MSVASAFIKDTYSYSLDPFMGEDIKINEQMSLTKKLNQNENEEWNLNLKLSLQRTVTLENNHCPICRHILRLNGTNKKVLYNDDLSKREVINLQRYQCSVHGEIKINYSRIFKDYGKYNEETKRQVKNTFALGTPPNKIQQIMIIHHLIYIPLRTIKNWVYSMEKDIKMTVSAKDMLCSGSVATDEIYVKLEGKKGYVQNTIDNRFNLVIRSDYTAILDDESVARHYKNMIINQNLHITSAVLDGHPSYNKAFKKEELDEIVHGTCHFHYSGNIKKSINEAAGLKKTSKDPLPPKYYHFWNKCRGIIKASTDFRFIIRIEQARSLANSIDDEKLLKIVDNMEKSKDQLQAHNKEEYLPTDTSHVESLNHEIEVYPKFKKGRKTGKGIELVSNTMSYVHNMRALQHIPTILDKEQDFWNRRQNIFGYSSGIRSGKIRLGFQKKKYIETKKNHYEFWERYLVKGAILLFEKLWGKHH